VSKPKLIVKSQGTPDLSSVKRCYLPGAVCESKCPNCGEVQANDMKGNYLMYPEQNSTHTVGFWCEPCEEEWDLEVKVTFTAKLVPSD